MSDIDFTVEAGVFYDFLKSSTFSSSIIDTLVVVTDKNLEVSSIGVANDRLVFCRSPFISVEKTGKWGITDTSGVASKIKNFGRKDEIRVKGNGKSQVRVERNKHRKFYDFDSVPINQLVSTSKLGVSIGKKDELLIKTLSDGTSIERGKFEAFFDASPNDLKDVFKANDAFNRDIILTSICAEEINISTFDDLEESGDSIPVTNYRCSVGSVISGYADLSEIVSNLKLKSTVKIAFGNNNMIVVQETISKEKGKIEVVQYTIMPKIKEEK